MVLALANSPRPAGEKTPAHDDRVEAAAHALARYRHDARLLLPNQVDYSAEQQLVDLLVGLLHWCDDRDLVFDHALGLAERLFVDELDPDCTGREVR